MGCFLENNIKEECFGCEACKQICPRNAIEIVEDEEGFRYPKINDKCIKCGLCKKICPYSNMPKGHSENKIAFGGYHKDWKIRDGSTSGGAFSAIVDAYCDSNYVIFGATAKGINVYHTYIEDKKDLYMFRKTKYSQSKIGNSYKDVKKFLKEGKKVLFSGTPCQIAGLRAFLNDIDTKDLLTVEVICEGVPSSLYMKKYEEYLKEKYGSQIDILDYRYTSGKNLLGNPIGKWDFQVMYTLLQNRKNNKKG